MQFIYLSLIILLLSSCSSPPPPVPFPETEEEIINNINYPKKTTRVIKNSSDDSYWSISESIYFDKNNSIQSTTSDLIKINYLLDHADKIILKGGAKSIQRMKTFIILSRNTDNIILVPECFSENYCSPIVNATFEKSKSKIN